MSPHLLVAPVVLPLVAGALLLLLEKAGSRWVPWLSLAATLALLAVTTRLIGLAAEGPVQVYLLGNWAAPWGIALALDRLSALMLLLTAAVAVAALVYALAGEARHGPHFHTLFQLQLMGLCGAFLTADLFNLFVFFEVLLAASYGLLLHGDDAGRRARLNATLHYVTFNLAGSALFLVAATLLYGLAGTLNLADLAVKLPQLGSENRRLADAASLLLLVVFAVKAALLPLYFWLPKAYASASAPVATLFAIMTKVGVYAILRCTALVFGPALAGPALAMLALATLVLAAVGALAATRLRGLIAYLVIGSAGTLLLGVGLGTEATLSAALFYLVPSTLFTAAWFLLADRIAAARGGSDGLTPQPFAGPWALLGIGFLIAAVAAAGLPPLAGFLGKALLLQAAGQTPLAVPSVALVLAASLATVVALARAGAVLFWQGGHQAHGGAPHQPAQSTATLLLLGALLAVSVGAGPLGDYTAATARQLVARQPYIDAVLTAQPVPAAIDVRREMRERGTK